MPDKPPFMYGFTARHTALSDIVVVVASRDGVAAAAARDSWLADSLGFRVGGSGRCSKLRLKETHGHRRATRGIARARRAAVTRGRARIETRADGRARWC